MASPRALLDHRFARPALLVAVLAIGAAVRLAPWPFVHGGEEPRLVGDGDPLYHLMQAERLVEGGLAGLWRDPGLNHPFGAEVPWPPLFDGLLAAAGWVAAGLSAPARADLVAGAILVPALLGVLLVLVVAWLAQALLGGRPWLDAALVLALLPSHAVNASLGRPDQHALEPVLLALVLLATARLARGGGRGPAALLAVSVTLSFWNWNGSALYLALVAGFAAAWHVRGRPGEAGPGRAAAWLAGGLGAGALLLAGSVALLAPATALLSARLSGLTGLQPTLVAGAALACAALAAARRLRPSAGAAERVATAGGALLLPAALLALLPFTRDGVGRGLTMLGARGWYRTIEEFRPLLPSGLRPLGEDLELVLSQHGLTLLLVVGALAVAHLRYGRAPEAERGPLLLFGVLAGGTLVLGWARNRFGVYLALAEALSTALCARALAGWLADRWPARRWLPAAGGAALGLAAVAPVLPGLPSAAWASTVPARYTDLAPLGRLAARVATPAGREAVLAPWSHGHDLRFWSGRPVVSSPFGIEGGEGALEVDSAFHHETSEAAAEALLASRRVGLVVVFSPLDEIVSLTAFRPPGAPAVYRQAPGEERVNEVQVEPVFRALVVTRLWLWDGLWGERDGRLLADGPAPLSAFRLLGETPSLSIWHQVGVPMFKLFQPVAGARLVASGLAPGTRVDASAQLRTSRGRVIPWRTFAVAGEDGAARLRLPYATGMNGEVEASPWLVTGGGASRVVAASERQVVAGARLEVRLAR